MFRALSCLCLRLKRSRHRPFFCLLRRSARMGGFITCSRHSKSWIVAFETCVLNHVKPTDSKPKWFNHVQYVIMYIAYIMCICKYIYVYIYLYHYRSTLFTIKKCVLKNTFWCSSHGIGVKSTMEVVPPYECVECMILIDGKQVFLGINVQHIHGGLMGFLWILPSGKSLHNYGKPSCSKLWCLKFWPGVAAVISVSAESFAH